ncbi:putative T7SS-secreted protein [Streptomyces sp. NPDC096205]|uniref:putative T7SS-secreted protein n=1 Tax=Streptomyces sp. NPDC096205 TaxID=3366081 RepID=UPI00381D9369
MARPADWAPLAEADPVPGDPEGIRREVTHMKNVAAKLRTQAAAMQAIADCDGLKGKYADELGDKARGLERRLDLAQDRYRKVKGHLDGWANDMETAQKKADRALEDAKDAQRILDAHKPDTAKQGSDKTTASEDPAVERAEEDLEAARRKLTSAVSFYSERADHYAGKIRSTIDDDMEDSWWNNLKAWVADADWLGEWADRLSWLATALSVVAVFFPAVGGIVVVLTAIVVGVHLLMALTGNGSWMDVLMDIGAFKMARNGVRAAKAVKGLQRESRAIAEGLAKQQAKRTATRASAARRATVGGKAGRLHRLADGNKARAAAREVRDAPLPEATRAGTAGAMGDKLMKQRIDDIRRARDAFPGNHALQKNAAEAERQLGIQRASWGVGTGLDLGDKTADNWDPLIGGTYGETKGDLTAPLPGTSQW